MIDTDTIIAIVVLVFIFAAFLVMAKEGNE